MRGILLTTTVLFLLATDSIAQNWGKQYREILKKIEIGEPDEFTGRRFINIKDPEFLAHGGVKINPYIGLVKNEEPYYRMKVRVGASNWVFAELLHIKIGDDILSFDLGDEVHSDTDCNQYGCINYQFYDIEIDQELLRKLAYDKSILIRASGKYNVDEELSPKRQERIRDLHTYVVLEQKIKAGN